MTTILADKIEDLRVKISDWKKQGFKVGLVPTMGALHKGHESLIVAAREQCDKVVVSIFLNPTQFGPNEDYDKYPKTLLKDKEICENLDVDIIFAPSVLEMYGENKVSNNDFTFVYPPYNYVDKLCGRARPGHFDGVATVVLKLFNIVQPDYSYFGQKDAQQFIILSKMVKDLNVPVKLVQCPIIRDKDGLALSSRNQYLTEEERKQAVSINKALYYIAELYKKGVTESKVLFDSAINLINKALDIEYLEFLDIETLENIENIDKPTLAAIAAKAGSVRLIDNIILR